MSAALDELNKLIAEQVQQQVQAQQQSQAQQPAQAQPVQFGLPATQPIVMPMQQPMGQMPQPTGVSVPVTVPLPDGRELSVRVHFGPEAAQNLQAAAAMAAQFFGPYLQARSPWNRGGGWNGQPRSSYGRRW